MVDENLIVAIVWLESCEWCGTQSETLTTLVPKEVALAGGVLEYVKKNYADDIEILVDEIYEYDLDHAEQEEITVFEPERGNVVFCYELEP